MGRIEVTFSLRSFWEFLIEINTWLAREVRKRGVAPFSGELSYLTSVLGRPVTLIFSPSIHLP